MIKKCSLCSAMVKPCTRTREGVRLNGMRCRKCGEEYYPSSELLKLEALT